MWQNHNHSRSCVSYTSLQVQSFTKNVSIRMAGKHPQTSVCMAQHREILDGIMTCCACKCFTSGCSFAHNNIYTEVEKKVSWVIRFNLAVWLLNRYVYLPRAHVT